MPLLFSASTKSSFSNTPLKVKDPTIVGDNVLLYFSNSGKNIGFIQN